MFSIKPNFKIKQRVQARMLYWVKKRRPAANSITLTQQRIFIFPTAFGGLFMLVVALIFVAGVNYANNLILSTAFLLFSVFVVAIASTYRQMSGLLLQVQQVPDTSAGQLCNVDFWLQTAQKNGTQPIGLQPIAKPSLPKNSQPQPCYVLPATSTVGQNISLPILCPHRGVMSLPPLYIFTTYPFGIMRAWSYLYFDAPIYVYPQPLESSVPVEALPDSQNEGDISPQIQGIDEFEQLKPYRAGERFSQLSWRHAAQGKGLLAKQFNDPAAQTQHVFDYAHMPAKTHEAKLSQLAYLVLQFEAKQQPYGLKVGGSVISENVGAGHLLACLRLLAQQPVFKEPTA